MADELLRALGRRQRQDPTAADPAAIDEQTMHSSTARDARTEDMLRPFDAAERASLLDAVFERLDADADAPAHADSPGTVRDDRAGDRAQAGEVEPPAEVVELATKRSRSRVGVIAIAASLAAALLVWLVLRPATAPDEAQVAALPEYAITQLRGGDAAVRSGPSEPPSSTSLALGRPIDWIFTPRTPARGALAVAVLATPERGTPVLTRVQAQISAEGVVRLRGPIDALGLDAPGRWTVDVIVARPEALPRDPDAAAGADGPWSRSRIEVNILASE